jgi:hypothetical protein
MGTDHARNMGRTSSSKAFDENTKKVYQDEHYSGVGIACAIDSGRGCNLSGYHNIFNVEKEKNKHRQCLLRSSSTIRNTMEVAEHLMIQKVPYTIIKGSKGQIHDDFEMDIKALFIHLICSFVLEEKAKGGECEIAITIDGAKRDTKINHIIFGFKITNTASRCPITGKLIFSLLKNMLSDEWSYPATTLFEDDSSATYETHFSGQFGYIRKVRREGIPELGWLTLLIAEPHGTKAHHITLDHGGAAKSYNKFCHYCSKRSFKIDKENAMPCYGCFEI